MAMFPTGILVICVNSKMDGIGPALAEGNKYLVKEYVSLEDLRSRPENKWWIHQWEKDTDNADMVILENGGGWSAKRFTR